MSRIGKKIIAIPAKTEVSLIDGVFTVKGPLGTLTKIFKPEIEIVIEAGSITLLPKTGSKGLSKKTTSLWGTYGSHIINMVSGVTTPYVKKLIVEGIGYKSEVKSVGASSTLVMALGFSHSVIVEIPEGLKVTAEKNVITVTGVDKEVVGAFVAKVRALKPPEPYKGKGIRYEGEVIKRKQGKKSA